MEIIQLICVASWWAGFCLIYTSFTWYIQMKNPKLAWQTIKGIINMKNKSDEPISSLLIDNQ